MPLLVVPLDPEDADSLTLAEWDALIQCERVLFERPDHPLALRLTEAGRPNGPFDDEPDALANGWALVADAGSPRIFELAAAGARVTAGSAQPPDELTAARGAYLVRRAASSLGTLATVMARLRGPDGCPWDAEQTHESLQVHLLEETYEVIEAIEEGRTGTDLADELGDVLLQVAFHAEMAAADGRFDLAGVADSLVAKLVRRHPHVFSDVKVADSHEVIANWESIKATEKEADGGDDGPFDGIPHALPALLAAHKTQKRATKLGFRADGDKARERLASILAEAGPEVVGDLLFWTVALARAEGVDPESALRGALRRFRRSFG
jgi:MazG family protein